MKEMKLVTLLTTVSCLALWGTVLTPEVKAEDWNRKTVVTFSGPVEIPGVHTPGFNVLPAGTYVFRIIDSLSDRHIVQIFNENETRVYATLLSIPNYRIAPTDKTVITFRERPAGQPEALRAWFYPGQNFGEEFVYPRAMALELAKTSATSVLYTEAKIPVEQTEPIKSADDPAVVEMKQAPVMAVKQTGETLSLADAAVPARELGTTPAAPAQTLPATASKYPLLGLLGLIALSGALVLRIAKSHTV